MGITTIFSFQPKHRTTKELDNCQIGSEESNHTILYVTQMYVPGFHVLFHTVYIREIQFCESAIFSLALPYFTHGLWDLLREYI